MIEIVTVAKHRLNAEHQLAESDCELGQVLKGLNKLIKAVFNAQRSALVRMEDVHKCREQ